MKRETRRDSLFELILYLIEIKNHSSQKCHSLLVIMERLLTSKVILLKTIY